MRMVPPWERDRWIPGVLSRRQILSLFEDGHITVEGAPKSSIDNSSVDLSLSGVAFAMVGGSVKPSGGKAYSWFIESQKLGERLKASGDGSFLLEAKKTYVFKLRERLGRGLVDGGVFGQATAKSSVGRVDVLARLIVDGMDSYECFNPEGLDNGNGDMYVEVTPITFAVRVKPGISLSQLRLFYGDPENVEIKGKQLYRAILSGPGADDGSLTVDLGNDKKGGLDVAAFFASPPRDGGEPIPLWEQSPKPEPWNYWKFQACEDSKRLRIRETNFYLLRSKERISVPRGIAIYCRASDETIGEMRIHYAGFVHPNFGVKREDGKHGTPLIFEVRGHQVDVSLADQEKLASLIFYRMSEDSDEGGTNYNNQSLQLSKFFADWPGKLKWKGEDGAVEPA